MIPRSEFKFLGHGILMGGADIIPGVSGGTVALILGIYERLVMAISRFDRELIRMLRERRWAAAGEHIDGGFLLCLGGGILTGIVSLASLMNMLLHEQRQHTFAVFFGLILGSSIIVARMVGRWSIELFFRVAIGAAVAYGLVGLPMLESPPEGLWYVVFCGAVAICAMILPGVSGAFLLLVLGVYGDITGALRSLVNLEFTDQALQTLGAFGLGATVGILSFSKFLSWLLKHWEQQVLSILCGLMLGSLRRLWPFQVDQSPDVVKLKLKQFENVWPEFSSANTWISLLLVAAGLAFVLLLEWWAVSRHKDTNKAE